MDDLAHDVVPSAPIRPAAPGAATAASRAGLPSHWPLQVWDFQRLLVNPFLFSLGPVLWCAGVYYFWSESTAAALPLLCLAPLAWLIGSGYLIQYHCCDCGRTGPLARWKHHVCEAVLHRAQNHDRGWFRLPSAATQAAFWALALAFALVALIARLLEQS
ncbi:MAG: hypothetical protein SFX72_18055 [Isosphaeraceae bacterium]|nr:hypothetical protein [Isosphaeraceae bacterium]